MNKLIFKWKLFRAKRRFKKGKRNPLPPNPLDYVDKKKLRKKIKDYKGLVVSG